MAKTGRPRVQARVRFEAKVDTGDGEGCWVWKGKPDVNGYGYFRLGGRERAKTAQSAAWVIFRGPLEEGKRVYRVCGVRTCVNPAHLVLEEPAGRRSRTR